MSVSQFVRSFGRLRRTVCRKMSCRRMSPNESSCNVGAVVKNVMVVSYRNATDYTISFHTAVGQIPLINQNFQEKFSYAGNKITTE